MAGTTPPTISDYYLSQFPDGVRDARKDVTSLTWKLDTARMEAVEAVEANVRQMGRQFQVLTADISIEDYENFLKIPLDSTLTLSERRAKILIKFAGQPATIANIMLIAKEITGIDITIREHGMPLDPNYDPSNHPWKVTIIVDYNIPGIKSFTREYFESIMIQVFPNHTEFESDSFIYIAPFSYLVPADPGRREFILDEEFLQFEGF